RDGRWYPALISLPDGRVLALSGLSSELQAPVGRNQNSKINDFHEIYSYPENWSYIGDFHPPQNTDWPLYPHVFVTPKGLFYSGAHVFGSNGLPPGFLTMSSGQFPPLNMTPAESADFDLDKRDQSASVLLPPAHLQRVMVMGGGGGDPETGTDKVHIVD